MSKSKLWRFKTFLIVAMLVMVAVAATPASAVYFSDSFMQINAGETETTPVFNMSDIISKSLSSLTGLNSEQLKASILGKF